MTVIRCMHRAFKERSWRRASDSSYMSSSQVRARTTGLVPQITALCSHKSLHLELGSVWKWVLPRTLAPHTASGPSLFLVLLLLSP